jgi:hypothetical protein
MFDTIKQVVTDSIEAQGGTTLARPYSRQIDAIVADICTHISKAGEDVITAAVENGIDEESARDVLVGAGLAVEREPEPEPEPEVVVANDTTVVNVEVDARLTAIETTLARLSALAERAERSGYLR